ncbi:DUF29 domain-containing protein [Aphanothece hegewaldii CCALA 016]|uniref:DUF29 domain-containing protein n=1 Tax=Aphanothece hegewaldii CCALA 016 TaxID=2107694 RepID=A0A2T1LV25_9CHRO|nr:DUF29 domain-containing protein [Aphanothece hegewaldii]PSF35538.1 DUF29 domain-containing protein [Aphanothece hegewaldii CCALA 016]
MKIATKTLYEQDFYRWIETTVNLLQERRWTEIERENLIEELISIGKSEKRQLSSRIITVLEHLLKLAYWEQERDYNTRVWKNTIIEQRKKIELILRDSPSLRSQLVDIFPECYQDAKEVTQRKTGLSFPDKSPFTIEQVLDADFFL